MVEIVSIFSVSIIDSILQAEDIEGLLELGAPKDEYSSEAAEIKCSLETLNPSDTTEDRISALVVSVWAKAFNLSGEEIEKRSPAFRRVARELLKLCSQSANRS